MEDFNFPGQTSLYRGKVRDVYGIGDKLLVMIVSNRISAFDVILPHPIPYKGQVLNQVAAFMLNETRTICPNWLLDTPAPNVSVGIRCIPFKFEMVVRGHLVGHAWRTYQSGKRSLCGSSLADGLKEYDALPEPIITPSTKAEVGHDEDITSSELIQRNIVTESQWQKIKDYSLSLFEKGKKLASERGLILADTKYEFGTYNDEIMLMDEVHTPDSSRYFYSDGFYNRQSRNEKQHQLSKEFVREWLIQNGFMGKQGQQVPEMSPQWINEISMKYIELYERMIGKKFQAEQFSDEETKQRIIGSLNRINGSKF